MSEILIFDRVTILATGEIATVQNVWERDASFEVRIGEGEPFEVTAGEVEKIEPAAPEPHLPPAIAAGIVSDIVELLR